jgi:hypothetical protein
MTLFGCQCKQEKNKNSNLGFEETKKERSEKQQGEIYYRFPSAKEMLNYIHTDKILFRTDLTNNPEHTRLYNDSKSQMLNLGVYLADLSYLILFDKANQTHDYFDASFKLATELRLSIPEQDEILQRLSDNMHNSDSLINISNEYQSDIIDYLINTGKEKTLAVISAGSYIEGLYIATRLLNQQSDNENAIQKIAEQKYAFKNLSSFIQQYSQDINASYSLDCLAPINDFMNNLPIIQDSTKVTRTGNNQLTFEGGEKVTINEEQFKELEKIVSDIRNKIVQNKEIEYE